MQGTNGLANTISVPRSELVLSFQTDSTRIARPLEFEWNHPLQPSENIRIICPSCGCSSRRATAPTTIHTKAKKNKTKKMYTQNRWIFQWNRNTQTTSSTIRIYSFVGSKKRESIGIFVCNLLALQLNCVRHKATTSSHTHTQYSGSSRTE